jgi:ribosomal protein S18 acetylase RimI-like enzyme
VVVAPVVDGARRPDRNVPAASLARSGIGRQLWHATEAFAREAGYRKLAIQVRASNTVAQSFYRGLGFKE